MKKPIRRFLVLPIAVTASILLKTCEKIVGEKYTYRKKDVQQLDRATLLDFLQNYHRKQGVAFFSEDDAEDYFRGLVDGIID